MFVTSYLYPLSLVDSEFIHTTLFGELQEDYVFYKGGSSCRLISLLGPKGLGKTTSMKQLMDADDMYIDLLSISDDITVPKDCKALFIDNAQMYDKDKVPLPLKPGKLRMKFVVAAFSPGIRCKDGHHNLSKACGDGLGVDFYFHPFEWEEAKQIPSILGFKIGKEDSLQKRTITQRRLNWLFCVTNGSPRYMKWYLEKFKLSRMRQELRKKYDQAESADARKNIPLSNTQIDQKILDLVVSGEGEDSSPASYLGLAYCIENSGCSKFKPASIYFASRAYSNLNGTVLASKWQRLEMLTQVLISATVCEIINAKDTMALPQANHCIHQPDIGIKCDSEIRNGAVTLLVLAEGHNVVDFILYDRRPQKANVFFVQTSSASYASKKKKSKDKMACLTHLVKKDDICISEVPISDYYTKFLKHNFIYVFATTLMLNWKFHSDIYFLDLLKFNPAVYGTTDECH